MSAHAWKTTIDAPTYGYVCEGILGGLGYAEAVKLRGGYFTHLVDTDPAALKREESDRIAATTSRSWI